MKDNKLLLLSALKIQIGGELEVILYHFFFYRSLITLVESILEQFYIGNKIIFQNVQLSIKFQLINYNNNK